MSIFFEALWFFLPAGIANMSPMLVSKIPGLKNLNTPIDFGKKYQGKRILGDSKTWRGVIFGALTAGGVGLLQYKVITHSSGPSSFIFAATAAMGLGALVGDSVESFFKRQLNIKPGASWFPFDQLDYVLGGLLFVYPFSQLRFNLIITIIFVYWGLHLIVNYLGYVFGIKDRPI